MGGAYRGFKDILSRWLKGYRLTGAKADMIVDLYERIMKASTDMNATSITDVGREETEYKPSITVSLDTIETYSMQGNIRIPNEWKSLRFKIIIHWPC